LIVTFGFPSVPLLFVLIVAINLGSNIIPQGAVCDIMMLKIARDPSVKNFNNKRLLKVGGIFALLHIFISFCYGIILTNFFV
jgi:Na+/H+ antiporter NhaD/arsenite permease-like protein